MYKYVYMLTGGIFGSFIYLVNISNWKRSPIGSNDKCISTEIRCQSAIKGIIYGVFWPILATR